MHLLKVSIQLSLSKEEQTASTDSALDCDVRVIMLAMGKQGFFVSTYFVAVNTDDLLSDFGNFCMDADMLIPFRLSEEIFAATECALECTGYLMLVFIFEVLYHVVIKYK